MIPAPLAYILDTGVANRVAFDHLPTLATLARSQFIDVPHIVIGELTFGAYLYAHRHNSVKFLTLYDTFYARYQQQIVTLEKDTALIYGAIYSELTATGALKQQNDVWIAALARQHQWTLATLDSDFTRISHLPSNSFSSANETSRLLLPVPRRVISILSVSIPPAVITVFTPPLCPMRFFGRATV